MWFLSVIAYKGLRTAGRSRIKVEMCGKEEDYVVVAAVKVEREGGGGG